MYDVRGELLQRFEKLETELSRDIARSGGVAAYLMLELKVADLAISSRQEAIVAEWNEALMVRHGLVARPGAPCDDRR